MTEKSQEEKEYEVRLEKDLSRTRGMTRYHTAAGISLIALILAFVTFNVTLIKFLLLGMAVLRAYGWGSLGNKYDIVSFVGYSGVLVYFLVNYP